MPQPVVIAILMGLLGAIVGSFLAAVSVRLPRDEGVVFGRSHCMSCERALAPAHLVPVLSWLWLKGRCGWCRAAISPRYILIELTAAGIGVWSGLTGGDWVFVAATALLGWQLLLIAIIDAENFWLPDILTWPLAVTGLIAATVMVHGIPWSQIVGAVAGFGSLWLLAWIYKRLRGRDGLGGGDPFLFGAAGAWVGWMGLPSVLLWACAAGFAIVVARLIVRRAVTGTDRLPFGTLLAVGLWLTWVYGPIGI